MPMLALLVASNACAAALPQDCGQLIVGIAPDWNSMRGRLYLLEKSGAQWRRQAGPVPALFGKNGLAWGSGVAGQDEQGLHKRERDGRAPAGIFRIGKIYTYDSSLPPGADYPFHQVSDADIWSDDPRSPNYNRHVIIDPRDPPVPGAGSAIFFHIRRGVNRPTTGCTTMAEQDLIQMIKWLRASKNPSYALLTAHDYSTKWQEWNLPPPDLVGVP